MSDILNIVLLHFSIGFARAGYVAQNTAWRIAGFVLAVLILFRYYMAFCDFDTDRAYIQTGLLIVSSVAMAAMVFLENARDEKSDDLELIAIGAYTVAWLFQGLDFVSLCMAWYISRVAAKVPQTYVETGTAFETQKKGLYQILTIFVLIVSWVLLHHLFTFNIYSLI
jgi:hypothetical protein